MFSDREESDLRCLAILNGVIYRASAEADDVHVATPAALAEDTQECVEYRLTLVTPRCRSAADIRCIVR